MANADTLFGARAITTARPGYTYSCVVDSGDAVALFVGDFVTHQGTSDLNLTTGLYLPRVAQAAASEKVFGFVLDFMPERPYENQIYRSASTERVAIICTDPYVLFEIQSSGTSSADDVGNNANITVGTGSTVTGLSGMELDQSTVTTTATLPLRIVQLMPRADNELGANSKLICMMNYCHFKDTTGQ